MTPDANAHLEAALRLAARGCRVFPIRPGSKIPLVAWVNGPEPATTDPSVITQWWAIRYQCASIGVACGPSGLVVIDIDGPEGDESWRQLVAEHGDVPTTAVTTGRDEGGRHLWYRAPGGIEVRNSAGLLAPGIDIRAVGGMVLAPPSSHPSGRRYRWGARLPMAELPAWIVTRVAESRQANHPRGGVVGLDSRRPPPSGSRDERWAQACLAELGRKVATTAKGDRPRSGRNHTLNASAYKLGTLVAGRLLDESDVIATLTDAAAACGLIDDDGEPAVMRTIRSGLTAGMRSPRTSGANT